MSEEFDKEAEREKLRQQLADEEADRAATQHLSELLLKGATMTNRHCDECGDPLFRHEGREFCPSCGRQRAATGAGESRGAADGGAAAAEGDAAPADESGTASQLDAPSAPTAPSPQSAGAQTTGDADLRAAREALARKVTALAHEAEATDDVGRARELLAAVREGAEALSALDAQP